jgi:T4-like virus tail tube protein gp19
MGNEQVKTDLRNTSYAAAHFALELSGVDDVGTVRSIEGGGLKADVMTYQPGANYERWRQLGKPKFEDIKMQVGTAMSEPFFRWIEGFFSGKCERKNGAIVAGDFYYKERARREFTDALITELTFPKLDSTDKSTVYMNVTLAVEDIVFKKGDPGKQLDPTAKTQESQKGWKSCNFTFALDGFADCTQVTKVDSFTIKQQVVEYHAGGRRTAAKTPSLIEYPQLSFYLPEHFTPALTDHFRKRGIKGEVPGRLHGQITTFDNSAEKATMFTLEFFNADIANIQPDKSDSTTEEIKQYKIDLYVERMSFKFGAQYKPEDSAKT